MMGREVFVRRQGRNVAVGVALLLIAASLLLAHGPLTLARRPQSGDPWFVVRWRVNRTGLPNGFVLKNARGVETCNRMERGGR
jgi:hypothetical protein